MNIIDWRIEYRCSDECTYCFASEHIPILSLDEERIVLEKICHSNVQVVNITGGEPMLDSSRCVRIIRTLYENGKDVYLSTNGYAFESWRKEVDKLALLGLPLDGYDGKSNTVNGRNKDAFSRVLEILNSNEIKGTNLKIGTVVTHNCVDDTRLKRISEFLDNYPIKLWRIYEMIPEGRGEKNRRILMLNEKERCGLHNIVRKISEMQHPYRIELVTREMRSSAYFIIQPNGVVMTPIDYGDSVSEIELGSLIELSINELEKRWQKIINTQEASQYNKNRYFDVKGVRL